MRSFSDSIRLRTIERNAARRTCARCRAAVEVRHNRTTGEPFLGCSRYPKCQWTSPVPVALTVPA